MGGVHVVAQVRGRFPSNDGSDDVDILLCNGESTDVGSSILTVGVYLLSPRKYADSVLLPLRSPGGIAVSDNRRVTLVLD